MITILLSLVSLFSQGDFYSLSATNIYGDSIRFSDYAGKKVLIVNSATNSEYVYQYNQLEALNQLYKDSLVIVAFPSNSFGHEPYDESNIIDFVNSNYHVTYLMGDIISVKGDDMPELYKWLTDSTRDGGAEVSGDFQKFLIDTDGKLIGVFAGSVDPMDALIQNSIKKVPN